MKTTEATGEHCASGNRDLRSGDRTELWARASATAGAAAWAGIAVLAHMGLFQLNAIELLFLLGPLVVVPLGMELGRSLDDGNVLEGLATRIQPVGAAMAVLAFWIPVGWNAGLAAMGWLLVSAVIALSGAVALWNRLRTDAVRITRGVGLIHLLVGGMWLIASRWGMRPMGIEEPIALLTAVHFHFAGFATAMIAAATLKFAQLRGEYPWLKFLVLIVAVAPLVVAAGFVVAPVIKMAAAISFSASVAGLAIVLRTCATNAQERTAGIFLQISAGSIFAGMLFSGAYAIADFLGSGGLTIAQMTQTHGILNAVGFCLAGLLGWLIEYDGLRTETSNE